MDTMIDNAKCGMMDDFCEQTDDFEKTGDYCKQTCDYCEQTGDYFLLILRNTFENENEYD